MGHKQTGLDESTFVNGGRPREAGGMITNWLLFGCHPFFVQFHRSSNSNLVYLNNDSYEITGSRPLLSLCFYN